MLTNGQIQEFRDNGFLSLGKQFNDSEVQLMNSELPMFFGAEGPKKILEKNGSMRSFFAPHEESLVLDKVARLTRLVEPAMQLLLSEVYFHQLKLNTKQALVGDWWEWHQDFPFWFVEDKMEAPRVLTAMIFFG